MLTVVDRRTIDAPIDRCFDLARSVEVHLAGNIHCGERATAGAATGLLTLGQQVTWRAKHFRVWHSLTSRITAFDRPVYFQDSMTRGPFRSMRHDHFFRALAPGRTEIEDRMFVAAPFGILGRIAEFAFLRRYMQALLDERNTVIQRIAESPAWSDWLPCALREKWLE